jgi:rRNA-processing protein FCF1
MQRVLIDSCGWVAVVEAGINIDIALAELIGPAEICVFPAVKKEIEDIAKNSGNSMLLSLLNAKATIVEPDLESGKHPDDQLFDLSLKQKWRILTIDRHLKHRLADAGLSWIEVQGRKRLVLLEN